MDNEVSIVNYNSVPISPVKIVRDDLSIGMPPLLEAISQVNESTSRSKKVQSSRDSRMAPAYELEAMIKRFNDSRVETQFQKIKKIIEQNPMLGKSIDFNKFVQKVV